MPICPVRPGHDHQHDTRQVPMLLSSRMLGAITLAVLGATGLLYGDRKQIEEILATEQTDAISISYLTQLMQIHPDDWGIRYQLAMQLYTTGQYELGWSYLTEVRATERSLVSEIQWRVLSIKIASSLSFFSESSLAERKQWRDKALSLIEFDRWNEAPVTSVYSIAQLANDIGAHTKAIELYTILSTIDIGHADQWWSEAAAIALSQNKPSAAGNYYLMASGAAEKNDGQYQYLQQAIEAFLFAEAYDDALAAGIAQTRLAPKDAATLIQTVELALNIGQIATAIRYLEQALAANTNTQQLEQLHRYSLNSEATDLALIAMERLHRQRPERVDYRRSLATLYEWQQQPEQALDHWLWISERTGEPVATVKARALAIGLFHSERLMALLEHIASERALNTTELHELVETLENLGRPQRAEQFLRGYLQTHDDPLAWRKLAKNLQDQQQYHDAIVVWRHFEQHYPLTQHDLFEHAYALQMTDQNTELLALLLRYQDRLHSLAVSEVPRFASQIEFEQNYWLLLANTSWLVEDIPVLITALEQAIALDPENRTHYDRYLSLGNLISVEQRLLVAQQAFKWFQQPDYGILLLEILMSRGDWHNVEVILSQLGQLPDINNECRFFYYQAQLAERRGNPREADNAFQQSIACSGQDEYLLAAYLYFLMNRDQPTMLRHWLEQWQAVATLTPTLWPVYAQAWSALGDTQQGQYWYQKAIEQQPGNLLLQMAYGDFLDFSGHSKSAWELRRQVLAQLSQHSLTALLPDDALRPYLLPVHTQFYGLAKSNEWLVRAYHNDRQQPQQASAARWLPSIILGLIEASDLHASDAWRRLGESLKVDFDATLLVSLALHDRERLYALYPQTPGGPLRTQALIAMGQPGHGLDYALGRLGQDQNPQWQNELLRQSTRLSSDSPSGVRLVLPYSTDDSSDSRGLEYTIARQQDEWHLQLNGQISRLNDNKLLFQAEPDARQSHGLQGTYFTRDGYLQATAYLTESDSRVTAGAQWRQYHQWDSHFSGSYALSYRTPAQQTRLQQALLNRSGLNLMAQYQLTPRNAISAAVNYDHFTDIYDDKFISKGLSGQGALSYQLLADYPQWNIRTGIDWQSYQAAEHLGPRLAASTLPGITPADLIDNRYLRYYISNRWQRGDVGALNTSAPTPQWFVELNVGYQFQPESTYEYSLTAGVGWRLFGDDELAVTTGYSRNTLQSLNGGDYQLQLSYQYRFGH